MSINKQRDVAIVALLHKEINELYKVLNIKLGNITGTNNDKAMAQKSYDKYNRQVKSSMVQNHMGNISKSLSKRFGIDIQVSYISNNLKNITTLIMPTVNYKMMNMALQGLDDLFPKKRMKDTIWDVVASDREKKIYNVLNNLKNGLNKGTIELDLENAYINGLEGSVFSINVDVLGAMVLNLTPQELTAMLLQQVGNIFSYIEYMTSTTNSTKVLADTFLKERFGKSKDPLDSLKFAVDATDVDVGFDTSTPIKTLESLDIFILKTYRLDASKNSVKIDFQRLSDQFATRFEIGSDVASSIIKLSTADIRQDRSGTRYLSDGSSNYIIAFITLIAAVVATLLFSIVGLLVVLVYVTIRLVSYMFALISRFISKIFSLIFIRGTDMSVEVEDIPKRLTKIKLELIREIRTTKASDSGKQLLVEQADFIKESIKDLTDKFTIIGRLSNSTTSLNYSKMEDINFLTEQLQENELHLLKEKFNLEG